MINCYGRNEKEMEQLSLFGVKLIVIPETNYDVRFLPKEVERVAYLVGKYFMREITLAFLKIQINAIEEPIYSSTTTS